MILYGKIMVNGFGVETNNFMVCLMLLRFQIMSFVGYKILSIYMWYEMATWKVYFKFVVLRVDFCQGKLFGDGEYHTYTI